MKGLTILDALPRSRRQARKSRYAPALEAALEHEGQWVRRDKFACDDQKRAQGLSRAVWYAARDTETRLGLRGRFQTAVREDGGRWFVYVRKQPAGETRS